MSDQVRQFHDVDRCVPLGRSGSPTVERGDGEGRGSPFGPAREVGAARRRIVETAGTLFCARGYERTPLRAISDSLGVTKAAVYYHFKAKGDLLAAVVKPMLDRIDELVDSVGPGLDSPGQRRAFLAAYVEELAAHRGVSTLLLRDPAVGEHALGRCFAHQHLRMRALLGAVDEPAAVIRAATALRALELAVVDFGATDAAHLRATAVDIAVAVLDSGGGFFGAS